MDRVFRAPRCFRFTIALVSLVIAFGCTQKTNRESSGNPISPTPTTSAEPAADEITVVVEGEWGPNGLVGMPPHGFSDLAPQSLSGSASFTCRTAGTGYQCTGKITVNLDRTLAREGVTTGSRVRAEFENSLMGGSLTMTSALLNAKTLKFNVNQRVSRCPFRNPDYFRLIDQRRKQRILRMSVTWSRTRC